jgi:hypothetical protein
MMKLTFFTLLLFTCLVGIAGKKNDLVELKIIPEENHLAYPGATLKIEVEGKNKKGKIKETANLIKNNLSWNSLEVNVDGGTFDKGTIVINRDFYLKKLARVTIVVSDKKNPDVKDSYSFELNTKTSQNADFSGSPGESGDKGDSGDSAESGTAGSGAYGENGKNGENGENLDVFITSDSIAGEKILKILIKNKETLKESAFMVNTNGGSIFIDASGGKGGDGGRGGRGGSGGDDANGGDGGTGGMGGSGGFGGVVNVTYDSTVIAFMHLITINVNGGEGGNGGRGGKRGKGDSNGSTGNSGSDGSSGYPGSEYRVLSPEKLKLNF